MDLLSEIGTILAEKRFLLVKIVEILGELIHLLSFFQTPAKVEKARNECANHINIKKQPPKGQLLHFFMKV
ncbi:hypothetical protein M4D55_22370 [Metabacillus idriensis]|uniref:hypothetical protein n=1 Tax=Metabacillus idriensis TaxID=324768 RepID=UPI002041A4BB|nr:hypothetical protein [Metabacillus idriensis]MCM3598509.1 hypothetical protein [Metabacillus idriensis]